MPNDDKFYDRDRPEDPSLPEDRPRGGRARPAKGGKSWGVIGVLVVIFILVLVGIALFP